MSNILFYTLTKVAADIKKNKSCIQILKTTSAFQFSKYCFQNLLIGRPIKFFKNQLSFFFFFFVTKQSIKLIVDLKV